MTSSFSGTIDLQPFVNVLVSSGASNFTFIKEVAIENSLVGSGNVSVVFNIPVSQPILYYTDRSFQTDLGVLTFKSYTDLSLQ